MSVAKDRRVRSTCADRVYRAIKGDIVSLKIRPGSIVNEVALAQQLGVSRTPVREALCRLGQERLVETIPKKGTIISDVGVRDVREAFQIRVALEPVATRLAAATMPAEVMRHLRETHVPPADLRGGVQWVQRDLHRAIARHCGNQRLSSVLESLQDDIGRILSILTAANSQTALLGLEHHLRIIAALERRDGDAAEQAMLDHILAYQDAIIAILTN